MCFKFLAVAGMLGVAGCTSQLPDITPYPNADDPVTGLRLTSNPGIITGYTHRDVTQPTSWRHLNPDRSPAGAGP